MKSMLQVFSFNVISKGLMGVTGILLIRYMGHIEYAYYTLAVSLVTVVTQALTVSFNRLYIVGHEGLNLDETTSPFLGFQTVAILALGLLALPFRGDAGNIYWFIILAALATCYSEFSKTFFQEKMKFFRFSMVEVSRTFLTAIGVLIAILFLGERLTAWQVLSVQAIAMMGIFLVVFGKELNFARLFRFKDVLKLSSSIVKGQYRYLFGYFFLFAFFGQMDVFMLRLLTDSSTLAIYGSAFRYYALVILALSSVHAVLLPRTQKEENIRKIEATYRKYMKVILLIAPVIILGAYLSQWIIPIIDRGKYPQAVTVFRILAVSSIISLLFSPHVNIVMKFEKFRYLYYLVCGAILLSAGLNLFLVPYLGVIGTAISTLVSFAFVNGLTYKKSRQVMRQCALAENSLQESSRSIIPEPEIEPELEHI
jgi:O-antigen/teichoic acid export membrane protein